MFASWLPGSFNRGLGYTATAAGIAIAISCNYVLLMLLGMSQESVANATSALPILGIAIAAILMLFVIGPILELMSLYPGSPSIRTYTYKSLGAEPSLLVTAGYLLVLISISGVESYLLLSLTATLMHEYLAMALVAVLLLSIVLVNYSGISVSDTLQRWSTAILWLGSLGLCWLAYLVTDTSTLSFTNAYQDTLSFEAVALAIFLFIGIELAATTVREPNDFYTLLPKSVYCAVLMIAGLYMSLAYVLILLSPEDVAGDNPLLFFAQVLETEIGRFVAVVLTIQALITCFNSGLRGASRMLFLLAREGLLSRRLLKLSDDGSTPVNAVLAISLCTLSLCVLTIKLGIANELSTLSAFLICLVYAALLIASCKVTQRKAQRRHYVSYVPTYCRYLLAAIFVVLGIVNLFDLLVTPVGMVVGISAALLLFCAWFFGRANGPNLSQLV